MKKTLFAAVATVLALLAAQGPVKADFVGFDYSWTPTPGTVPQTSGGVGSITITGESGTAETPTFVTAADLKTHSSIVIPTHSTTDPSAVFTNAGFSLTLHLTDHDSGLSGDLTFGGVFNGHLSSHSSTVTVGYTNPVTQTILLHYNLYTVTIGPASNLKSPNVAGNSGTISADISAVSQAPEPSTMLLSSLGMSFMGLVSWRKRRNALTV